MKSQRYIIRKEFKDLENLVSNLYNTLVVLHYFCLAQTEIEELNNILPVVHKLRQDADTLNAYFINFNQE